MKKSSEQSYLERIKFDPNLRKGAVFGWITNIRVIILTILVILVVGVIGYLNLPKRLNPGINIPIVSIVTVLPGASPEDIESLVTVPLESSVNDISGIDSISSVSQTNTSVISIQFRSGVSRDKALQDVQTAVSSVSELPSDALTPRIRGLDFEDSPIWTFSLTTSSGNASLMRFGQALKTSLERLPEVDRVVIFGLENEEIAVTVSPEKVRDMGLNPLALASSIKGFLRSYPAGSLTTDENTFALSIDPTVLSIGDIRDIRLQVSGITVRLGDIADVSLRPSYAATSSYTADPDTAAQRSLTVNVYKTSRMNFDTADEAIQKAVKRELALTGDAFTLRTVENAAEQIEEQYSELLGEFGTTILLVMGALFVFLGLRQALISSLTVPLTFLMTFAIMNALGQTINFLSLFAFLIALGLLVDDTIVTVQSMTTYYRTGKFTPEETGRIVWRDLIVPIWSTTLTTIWSFLPLLLATGIIGEFIKPIPILITAIMISSTSIAVLITLPIMIVLLRPRFPMRVVWMLRIIALASALGVSVWLVRDNPLLGAIAIVYLIIARVFFLVRKPLLSKGQDLYRRNATASKLTRLLRRYADTGVISIEPLSQAYYRLIKRILASRASRVKVITGIVAYALWAFLLVPLGFVPNEFFPKIDADIIYVNFEKPAGTNTEIVTKDALTLLEDVRTSEGISFATLDVGAGLSGFGAAQQDAPGNALFTLHLVDPSRRDESTRIAKSIRDRYADYPTGKVSVREVSAGPPAGSDLQIELRGADLTLLDGYADSLVSFLETQNGVTNIEKSIKQGTSKIVFVPDPERLAATGISIDSIGLWLRTFASGFTLADGRFDKDSADTTDIVFSYGTGLRSADELSTLQIPTQRGNVPLITLGDLRAKVNPTSITREDGQRTITVRAAVEKGFNVSAINTDFTDYAATLDLPEGYSWKTGGINEENAKSVTSIIQAMGLAFILILVTMVVQFRSYRQAAIVLMVIPLAVSSVFVIFAVTRTPLSFPALIGILSLFGIVVTNSMFIVDKININLKEGMPFEEAIADAGASRLEPIILTKLATVLGLLPITLSDPLWRGLGGAIISGILLASTIMLLFIPAVYYEWFKEKGVRRIPRN